jgi:hypothetical protein
MSTLRIENIKSIKGPRMAERRAAFAAKEQAARDRERLRLEVRASWEGVLLGDYLSSNEKKKIIAVLKHIVEHFDKSATDTSLRPDVIELKGDLAKLDGVPRPVTQMLACAGINTHSLTLEADGYDSDSNKTYDRFWVMASIPADVHRSWCRESEPRCGDRAEALASLGIGGATLKRNMDRFLKARAAWFISMFDAQVLLDPTCDSFAIDPVSRFDGGDLIAAINKTLADNEILFTASLNPPFDHVFFDLM